MNRTNSIDNRHWYDKRGFQVKRYKVIYADPSWQYRDKNANGNRGACFHYKTMSLKDMMAMPVPEIAAPDSACLMWAVSPMLEDAITLLKSWDYTYKTIAFSWTKLNKKPLDAAGIVKAQRERKAIVEYNNQYYTVKMGLGHHTRGNLEVVLLGVRGKGNRRINADVHQTIIAPARAHSQKPDEARERIVQLYGNVPRLEMFARDKFKGWDVYGNEVKSSIVLPGEAA